MATPETSREAQKILKRREKRHQRERVDALQFVMGDPRGRRFVYEEIFVNGHLTDVYLQADSGIYRHEGKRERAVKLAIEIQQHFPEEYVLMITERLRDQRGDELARENAADAAADTGDDR